MNGLMFSAPMILRLADTESPKTQTRRVVKDGATSCPYGAPGDRLWVREAIQKSRRGAKYSADGERVLGLKKWEWHGPKLSPLFLPRAFSRFEIQILEVRRQRLKDISHEDAIAEGAYMWKRGQYGHENWTMQPLEKAAEGLGSARMAFANAFNVIHGGANWNLKPGPAPWDQNPEVWAISFKTRWLNGPYCMCGGKVCEGTERANGKRYRCPKCQRRVLWCFGADDESVELCDDCAQEKSEEAA